MKTKIRQQCIGLKQRLMAGYSPDAVNCPDEEEIETKIAGIL